MRTTAAILLLAAACAPAPETTVAPLAQAVAPAASLAGSWNLTQVNGHPIPAESPMEPGVTMDRASLVLADGGAFTMTIAAHTAGQPTGEQSQRGTWTSDATTLTLTPSAGETLSFGYTLDGATLALRAHGGTDVFTLTRG